MLGVVTAALAFPNRVPALEPVGELASILHQQRVAFLCRRGCVRDRRQAAEIMQQRALLHYFSGLTTVADATPAAQKCDTLLVQYGRQFPDRLKGWHTVW